MICPKCGKENNYYHMFCFSCGYKLPENEDHEKPGQAGFLSTHSAIVFSDEKDAQYRRMSSMNRKVIRFAFVLLSSVILILCIFVFGSDFIANRSIINHSSPPLSMTVDTPYASSMPSASTPNVSPALNTSAPTASPEPLSLVLTKPSSGNDTTEDGTYTVLLKTNGVRIYINNIQNDAIPDKNGNASIKLDVSQYGINMFLIRAEDEYGQKKECDLNIERLLPAMKLLLSDNQVLTTEKSNIAITGKTESNAVITIVSDLANQSVVNADAEGNFGVIFDLPVIPGQHKVTLKTNADNYREASLTCIVTKILDENAYRKAAVACNYKNLTSNPDDYNGKVVYLSGTVENLDVADNKKFTFLINNKKSQEIYVEYVGETRMMKGASRRLYGEYIGLYNGIPHLLVRLAYRITPINS